jgi:hypothetical protein
MAVGWKIVASTKGLGGRAREQFFLVAIPDRELALDAIHARRNMSDCELTVVGEATPNNLNNLRVKSGEIFTIWGIAP